MLSLEEMSPNFKVTRKFGGKIYHLLFATSLDLTALGNLRIVLKEIGFFNRVTSGWTRKVDVDGQVVKVDRCRYYNLWVRDKNNDNVVTDKMYWERVYKEEDIDDEKMVEVYHSP